MTKQEALSKIKELEKFILESDNKPFEIKMVPIKNLTSIDFEIGVYPVTNKQWRFIYPNHAIDESDNLPVTNITFGEVLEYINQLNVITKGRYRLPSEHEWLVCATIDGTLYSGSNNINEVAWYRKNCNSKMPVNTLNPNSLGIYHMSGNVAEMCNNYYEKSEVIITRGGSWCFDAEYCRAARRLSWLPTYHDVDVGFRLAKSL